MQSITLGVAGIGFWCDGLPDWNAACAYVQKNITQETPRRPAARLLAPNEQRRIPDNVAVALEAARMACLAAEIAPSCLPSIFASRNGDQTIADYMCATLANQPLSVSPTKFHNSVHNAAAGYWTIGVGSVQPSTAISADAASIAQGLLDAAAQIATETPAVLLVGYDGPGVGPLGRVAPSEGLVGCGLVLVAQSQSAQHTVTLRIGQGQAPMPTGPLSRRYKKNASVALMSLCDVLSGALPAVQLPAGPNQILEFELVVPQDVP